MLSLDYDHADDPLYQRPERSEMCSGYLIIEHVN